MKRFVLVAMLVGALAALSVGTALAAGPVNPPAQGFGPGTGTLAPALRSGVPGMAGHAGVGMHTPGTGMTNPGTGYGPGMGAGGMMGRGAPEWAGEPEAVEKLLDMTEEQIQAERLAGKSLAQIATSKKINEETLIKTILDAKKADLAKLVADGNLTQAQIDTMVERMQTQVKAMVERTNVGPAFDGTARGQARPGMGQGFRGGRGANR